MDNFEVSDNDLEAQAKITEFEKKINYSNGIDASKVWFDHHVPFTADDDYLKDIIDYPGSDADDIGD